MLDDLINVPWDEIIKTLRCFVKGDESTDQERKDIEDLIMIGGQSEPQVEEVIGSIITSLLKNDASKFKTFLNVLRKNNKLKDVAEKLGKQISNSLIQV